MKSNIKSKLFGSLLSDGSARILSVPGYSLQDPLSLGVKDVDILNHPVWTGRRPKEQTEISAFIGRFDNTSIKKG